MLKPADLNKTKDSILSETLFSRQQQPCTKEKLPASPLKFNTNSTATLRSKTPATYLRNTVSQTD